MPYLGETLALLTAAVWATAVIFFKKGGETVHPVALNILKTGMAAVLFIPTFWFFGESPFHAAPLSDYLLMLAGGVLGLALADTMFFMSLNLLGAGLTAIVSCLYSPFIIGLSILFLHETLSLFQAVGVALILTGVLTPAFETKETNITRRNLVVGMLWGAGSLAVMAASIVMVKPILDESPLVWCCEIRMLGGVLGLLAYLAIHPDRGNIMSSLKGAGLRLSLIGSFLGGYLGLLLWVAGMKYTYASVASALIQTSNMFLFILAAFVLREPITRQRLVGIVMSGAGAVLVMFA